MAFRDSEWGNWRMVTIEPARTGSVTVLTVGGEIDLASGPRLRAVLDEILEDPGVRAGDGPACIVLDLTGVTFLGSVGLALLVDAHERAGHRGIALKVVIDGPGSPVARALQAAAIDEILDVHPSVAGALPGDGPTGP